jgi:hypothetical protein
MKMRGFDISDEQWNAVKKAAAAQSLTAACWLREVISRALVCPDLHSALSPMVPVKSARPAFEASHRVARQTKLVGRK